MVNNAHDHEEKALKRRVVEQVEDTGLGSIYRAEAEEPHDQTQL